MERTADEHAAWMAAQVIDAGLAAPGEMHGCTAQEVADLQERVSVVLPSAYCGFLLAMGRDAGGFMAGTDMFYGPDPTHLPVARDAVQALMDRDPVAGTYRLADSVYVFAAHQGYSFLFFHAEEGEDPPVHLYVHGLEKPKQVADTFSRWFSEAVHDFAEA